MQSFRRRRNSPPTGAYDTLITSCASTIERHSMSEILAFQAILFGCGTIAFVATLRFVRRFLELRHDKLLRTPNSDHAERLVRIETAVESTAVEVERIAEASRFIAKLLSDRGVPTTALGKSPERVITPH
jgi:hypothetical protein